MKKRFLKGNTIYIIWFVFYFLLTMWAVSFFTIGVLTPLLITTGIYTILLTLAFTPAGEKLFKLLHGVRPLYTNKEKEKILPLAREVHKVIKKKSKKIKSSAEICISDSLIPNAFAMGENTIVVTKGLIESMTDEQIKGILAHEYGHLAHGDTKAVVFTFIGNGVLNISTMLARKVLLFLIMITDSLQIGLIGTTLFGIIGVIFRIFLFLLDIAVFVTQLGGELILMAKSRYNEWLADYFAYKMNYGEELVSALYDLELMTSGQTLTLMEQLKASHPHTAKRIGSLEFWLGISIK
ncbi:MAG: M48 family metalloprotease [Oscillospiraceae bacterium]|nr:M48 family metalloprotease [Oscillospiraceae bacterium]